MTTRQLIDSWDLVNLPGSPYPTRVGIVSISAHDARILLECMYQHESQIARQNKTVLKLRSDYDYGLWNPLVSDIVITDGPAGLTILDGHNRANMIATLDKDVEIQVGVRVITIPDDTTYKRMWGSYNVNTTQRAIPVLAEHLGLFRPRPLFVNRKGSGASAGTYSPQMSAILMVYCGFGEIKLNSNSLSEWGRVITSVDGRHLAGAWECLRAITTRYSFDGPTSKAAITKLDGKIPLMAILLAIYMRNAKKLQEFLDIMFAQVAQSADEEHIQRPWNHLKGVVSTGNRADIRAYVADFPWRFLRVWNAYRDNKKFPTNLVSNANGLYPIHGTDYVYDTSYRLSYKSVKDLRCTSFPS